MSKRDELLAIAFEGHAAWEAHEAKRRREGSQFVCTVSLERMDGEASLESPTRCFVLSATHTFEQLAYAIDLAFGRWNLRDGYAFELPNGEIVAPLDERDAIDEIDPDREILSLVGARDEAAYRVVFRGIAIEHRVTLIAVTRRHHEVDRWPGPPLSVAGWGAAPLYDQTYEQALLRPRS